MIRIIYSLVRTLLPEQRKLSHLVILPKFIKAKLNLQNNAEYLCYLAACFTQMIALVLFLIQLFLMRSGGSITLSPADTSGSPINLYMDMMGTVCIVIITFFYLAIRLSVNIRNGAIPVWISSKSLKSKSKRETVQICIFLLVVILLTVSPLADHVSGYLKMYGLENNFQVVSLLQITLICILPTMVGVCISLALMTEKAIRFFPDFSKNINNL